MNRQQFEEQLKKLSPDYKRITNDNNQLWLSISSKISDAEQDQLSIREMAFETPIRTTFMRYAPAMLILLVIFGSGVTAVSASQSTLPGDLLYPLQRAVENVREKTIVKSKSRIEFKIHKAEKRLDEINKMKSLYASQEASAPTIVNTNDYDEALLDAVENFEDQVESIKNTPKLKEKKSEWQKRLYILQKASEDVEFNDEDKLDRQENDKKDSDND